VGKIVVLGKLVARDLRRWPMQTALLVVAILAATATLTLGLALHGVISQPYQQTRTETSGPDVVASYTDLPPMSEGPTPNGPKGPKEAPACGKIAGHTGGAVRVSGLMPCVSPAVALAAMRALTRVPGVAGHSGPYPVAWATLRVGSLTAGAIAEGRPPGRAAINQPKLTAGSWISADGVVVERSFADALGAHVGERITLDGRPFHVAGIAVTAADVPYPEANDVLAPSFFPSDQSGIVWLTQGTAQSFATASLPLSYTLNLRLASPAATPAFVQAHSSGVFQSLLLTPWQQIAQQDNKLIMDEQEVLLVGSWLLGLLAVASVAVIVGGRMAEQTRRVGLLKAVGGTPRFVVAVLLVENLLLALAAAAAGLGVGWLAAPLLTSPGSGLVGTAGAPSVTVMTVGLVAAVAVAVAVVATFVPAVQASRTSTVDALAEAARRPERRRALIALSRRLPVPLLLAVRLTARRPRRSVLAGISVAITATALVAVLCVHAREDRVPGGTRGLSVLANPEFNRLDQVLLVLTVMLTALAAINALFITRSTAVDARQSSALARALGASPRQVATALSMVQLIPSAPGALLGIPLGLLLVAAVGQGGTANIPVPPAWWLAVMVAGVLAAMTVLTAIPARAGARRSPAEILQAETA
jgi:putative ABC transport system permease protein